MSWRSAGDLVSDFLALSAFEVGLFGWMAIMQLVWFRSPRLATDHAAFWFLMRVGMLIGFVTTYPVNWWLIRHGTRGTSQVYRRSITPCHREPLAKPPHQTSERQARAICHDLQHSPSRRERAQLALAGLGADRSLATADRARIQYGLLTWGGDDPTSHPDVAGALPAEARADARRSARALRLPADPATMLRAALRNHRDLPGSWQARHRGGLLP
jgi:hypothetical protein